jgi:hypothetical protein
VYFKFVADLERYVMLPANGGRQVVEMRILGWKEKVA